MNSPVSRLATLLRERSLSGVVLELFLIVTGVLLALGVDGWMQGLEERKVERESLELLRSDLQLLGEQLDEFISYHDAQQASGVLVYEALASDRVLEPTVQLAAAIKDLGARRTLALPRSAYEELVTTGSLRLVEDAGLRRDIVRFYQTLSRDEAIIARNNETFIDQLAVRLLVGEGMVVPGRPTTAESEIGDVVGPVGVRVFDLLGASPVERGRIWQLQPGDRDWTRVEAMAAQVTGASVTAQYLAEVTRERALELVAQIEAALR